MRTGFAVLPAMLVCVAAAWATDWPQVGANPQHTNFTPDSPAPPYQHAWTADFSPEEFYSAQPVIQGDRVYATTLSGSLYALDLASGKRIWQFKAGEVIWGSAACGSKELGGEGLVFVAAWPGYVYGLDAATGQQRWRYDAEEPISGSPCLAGNTMFIGTRKGTVLALGTDGALKWKAPLSWEIFNTVAWDAGKVYVLTMDVRAHCLDAQTGKVLWTSDQLWGIVPREFYPVIHKGRMLISITPSGWRADGGLAPFSWAPPKAILDKVAPGAPNAAGSKEPNKESRAWVVKPGQMPQELEAAQKQIIDFYQRSPEYQSFYVLDAATGKQAYYAVHLYGAGGLENLVMPPAVCQDGTVVMACMFSALRMARLDLEANRWVDILYEADGRNNDNSSYVSVGGSRVFMKNFIGSDWVMDLSTRKATPLNVPAAKAPVRVSVYPARPSPLEALSARRLNYSGASPPVISGDYVLWCKGEGNLLMAYKRSVP